MKIVFDAKGFFEKLDERLVLKGTQPLNEDQEDVLRALMYDGLGLKVQPDGLEVECGTLHIVALGRNGGQLADNEPPLSDMFALPGFPLEHNVTKLSLTLDATISKPVTIDMTVFPFKLDFPTFQKNENTDKT